MLMAEDEEQFTLEVMDRPGESRHRGLWLAGVLKIFVRAGSQYATWRQFPMAVRYEVQAPDGEVRMTPDLSLSISEGPEVFEGYAAQPCNAVIEESFECSSLLDDFPKCFEQHGLYRLRAHYLGLTSNWAQVRL